MKPRRIVSADEAIELVDAAVQEHALAVVSVQQDDGWHSFKSRFLERDPRRQFFVLDHHGAHGTTPATLHVGQCVGVSFRNRSRKVMFATVAEAKGRFLGPEGESIPAVRYRWPEAITELQRRAYFRTPVPAGVCILVNVWPGGVSARAASQQGPLNVVCGEAIDLSCGGTLVRVGPSAPITWAESQTLGVELSLPDGRSPVLLNAYFRGTRQEADGSSCVALQFVGMELSSEGRAVLTRMARCVQKFHRQMLASDLRSRPGRVAMD